MHLSIPKKIFFKLLYLGDAVLPSSSIGDRKCFTGGINLLRSYSSGKCSCKTDTYYGLDCGIPKEIFLQSPGLNLKRLRRRETPRRIIQALPVNHEFDMFEVRANSLYDVVDVFLVGESNYTNAGTAKDTLFLHKFQAGWLKNFQVC